MFFRKLATNSVQCRCLYDFALWSVWRML